MNRKKTGLYRAKYALLAALLWVCVCAGCAARTEDPAEDVPAAPAGTEELSGPAASAVPTAYPEGDPALTVPLADLTPCEPLAAELKRYTVDGAQLMSGEGKSLVVGDLLIQGVRLPNQYYGVAVIRDPGENGEGAVRDVDVFLQTWDSAFSMELFHGLFGCEEGLTVSYTTGQADIRDYYVFAEDGTPTLLVRARGAVEVLDLDGDGVSELASTSGDSAQVFFRRDGQLYQAQIDRLLGEAWPESAHTGFGWAWDVERRSLAVWGWVMFPGTDVTGTADRTLYFDGEALRLYKDPDPEIVDHAAVGISAPEDVLELVKERVLAEYESRLPYEDETCVMDDWRITEVSGPYWESVGEDVIEIYNYNYDLHTATPEKVLLAGGRSIGEDGWVTPGYPGCDYLFFLSEEDGSRTFLFHMVHNDGGPQAPIFHEDLVRALESARFGVETVDHVLVTAAAPEEVLTAVKERVRDSFEEWDQAYLPMDDWRVSAVACESWSVDGTEVERWEYEWDIHTTARKSVAYFPDRVAEIRMDGWFTPQRWYGEGLYFRVEEDGRRTFLTTAGDIPGDPVGVSDKEMARRALAVLAE